MKVLGRITLLAIALAALGCGSKQPAAESGTSDSSATNTKSAPLDQAGTATESGTGTKSGEETGGKSDSASQATVDPLANLKPPKYKADQLAGIFRAAISDDDVAAAEAQGVHLKDDWPILTLGKDSSWIMGTESGKQGDAHGHFKLSGSQIILVPEMVSGNPVKPEDVAKSTRVFDIIENGKAVSLSDPNGKQLLVFRKKD